MMIRRLAVPALVLALLSPLSTAKAVGVQDYNVCGGTYSSWSGFAFCASVQISVVANGPGVWTVALQIANLSGTNGSYAGSHFAQLGIDNIGGSLASPANIVLKQNGAVVCSNPTNNQAGNAGCWSINEDQTAAGGINVDFLNQTANGVNQSLSSACSGAENRLYTCLGAAPVTISFDINTNFNPATSGQLYIKAQGALGSTECETGNTASPCTTSVTATPEPATLALMGTGFLGLLPIGVRRFRRRDTEDTEDAAIG